MKYLDADKMRGKVGKGERIRMSHLPLQLPHSAMVFGVRFFSAINHLWKDIWHEALVVVNGWGLFKFDKCTLGERITRDTAVVSCFNQKELQQLWGFAYLYLSIYTMLTLSPKYCKGTPATRKLYRSQNNLSLKLNFLLLLVDTKQEWLFLSRVHGQNSHVFQ